MGSVWNHAMCAECWNERHPEMPAPLRVGEERCCFCGRRRAAGIYVRENPAHLPCKGRHRAGEMDDPNCWHEPADPAASDTICWHCGAMIKRAYKNRDAPAGDEWILNECLLPAASATRLRQTALLWRGKTNGEPR